MSTFTSSGAFATLSANNSQLYSRNNNAFAIHQRNNFIKTRSPKVQIQKLTKMQKERIKEKMKQYTSSENRNAMIAAALSLSITAGLVTLAYQALTLL
ncbi:MAG: hypothetical protein Roseis2KO_32370 [Roseivirga sp.]